jgi:chromosome partitioning protein
MIITVGGIKGGSGKTTIATNLAVMRAAEGRDVLLIDADDQETASDFTVLRNERTGGNAGYTSIQLSGAAVRNQTLRLADKYQDIIIDTGGRDTTSQRAALTIADQLLIPFVPRSFDIWTVQKVAALVNEMKPANAKLTAYTFLNRADSRGQDNEEAADGIRMYLIPIWYQQKSGVEFNGNYPKAQRHSAAAGHRRVDQPGRHRAGAGKGTRCRERIGRGDCTHPGQDTG